MKLRVVIADDERLARQRLRRFLNQDGQLEIVAECDGGTAALEAVRKHKPDLLLLDVEMPERDGFDVVAQLAAETSPVIVFVTAHDRHAVRAFEACAHRLLAQTNFSGTGSHHVNARAQPSFKTARPAIGHRAKNVRRAELFYRPQRPIYSCYPAPRNRLDRSGWQLRGPSYRIAESPYARDDGDIGKETATQFARVSRSAIVQLTRVNQFRSWKGRHVALLRQGDEIPITRSIREVEAQLRSL